MSTKRVLVPLAPGFEEIETITPADLLRRAGVEVTLAALGDSLLVEGRTRITVKADVLFEAVSVEDYDALFLPGGPGVGVLRKHPRIGAVVRDFAAAGKWIGAICAAPLLLNDAGLLAGRRFTAHDSTQAELPEALVGERVVRDGKIITSRGAGTALDFGLALIRALVDDTAADQVAKAILA